MQQFFREVDAVRQVLTEVLQRPLVEGAAGTLSEEEIAAVWQAVELLGRAGHVLAHQYTAEKSLEVLFLPESQETDE